MIAAFSSAAMALQGFGTAWWKSLLGGALMFAPAFLLGQCSVKVDKICEGREATKSVKSMKLNRAADDAAGIERRRDDSAVQNQSTQVKDATDAIPDAPLSPRQRARACVLLRQNGAPPADLGAAGC